MTLRVLGAEHISNRFNRINQLRHLKCVYAKDTSFPGYWFMVNATEFPPVPAQPWQEMLVDGAPSSRVALNIPQWLDSTRPFQGFAPTYGANLGETLRVLRVPDSAIPHMISKTGAGLYALNTPVRDAWNAIEKMLERIVHFLLEPLHHLPAPRLPRPPTAYGYADEYPTKAAAITRVQLSRDAFNVMLIFISFALAHWRFQSHTYPLDPVLSYFEKHCPAEYSTLYDLVSDSCVGDFRVGTRAGYFIDLFNYPGDWTPYLHIWAEAGVPLWIYAGPRPTDCVDGYQAESSAIPKALRDWMPSRIVLAAAMGKFLSGILNYAHSPPPPPSFDHRPIQGHTLLVPALRSFAVIHGDYEHGISPETYFERKRRAFAQWQSSDWLTTEALSHARNLGDCSKWKARFLGYRMYVWERERGTWHRRIIDNTAKRAFFEIHSPSQRYWCPIAEEMDLCWWLDVSAGEVDLEATAGAPHLLFSTPDRGVDTSTIYLFDSTPPTLDTSTIASPPRPPSVERPQYGDPQPVVTPRSPSQDPSDESDYDSASDTPRAAHHPNVELSINTVAPRSWRSTLSIRLGYDDRRELPSWHLRRSVALFTNPQNRVANVLKCLGDLASNAPHEDREVSSLVDAVNTLGLAAASDRRLLPACWDISPLRFDKPALPPNLSAYQIRFEGESGIVRRCVLATSTQALEDQWWVFSMTGTALLQVLRSEHKGMLAIGRYLISCGIPFNTTIATRHLELPAPPQIARQGLGSLTSDDTFTSAKYAHYVAQKNAALVAGLGPLALKAGGIIWRLSIESATPRLIKDALRPPSSSAAARKYVCGSLGKHSFVADQFRPHELDIILGAYRMKKRLPTRPGGGTSGRTRTAEDEWSSETIVYLWPTEYAWSSSGLNIGEWSRECEAWYQARVASLQAGTAAPMSSTEWRSSLRKLRAAHTVWETYDKLVHETFFDVKQ